MDDKKTATQDAQHDTKNDPKRPVTQNQDPKHQEPVKHPVNQDPKDLDPTKPQDPTKQHDPTHNVQGQSEKHDKAKPAILQNK